MTSTDTGSALLRAILEDPTDDAVRLVYADWLDEQGQSERAEYIRVALRLYHYRTLEIEGVTWDELFTRAETLLARHQFAWRNDSCSGLPWGNWVSEFHRGFVCEVRLTLTDFMRHAQALFAHHPIERVVLTDREPSPYVGPMTCYSWRTSRGSPFTGDDSHPVVPEPIYDLLDGGWWLDPRPSHREWYAYPTSDDARAAISRACVVCGRQQAGLSPLPAK